MSREEKHLQSQRAFVEKIVRMAISLLCQREEAEFNYYVSAIADEVMIRLKELGIEAPTYERLNPSVYSAIRIAVNDNGESWSTETLGQSALGALELWRVKVSKKMQDSIGKIALIYKLVLRRVAERPEQKEGVKSADEEAAIDPVMVLLELADVGAFEGRSINATDILGVMDLEVEGMKKAPVLWLECDDQAKELVIQTAIKICGVLPEAAMEMTDSGPIIYSAVWSISGAADEAA